MDTVPQKIGKYDVLKPLGKGAMGVVYKGRDPGIGRLVALKTVHLSLLETQTSEVAQRFQREAQAAGGLNHPNIISIYEYGEDAGRAFIAMEYVEGRTLAELFNRGHRFDTAEILRILSGILAALEYSHRMGVVHRDIKPGNIMIDTTGTVKVMDFGVARLDSSDMTQAGTIIGTPGYMSPEQLLGDRADARSDLYSTGILLYELLTHERAFTGSSLSSVVYKVVNSDLLPPSRLKPTVPGVWDRIVATACAKQPELRYPSAAQFLSDLTQAIQLPGRDTPAPQQSAPDHPGTQKQEKSSRAMMALFLILLVVAVSTGGLYWKMRMKQELPPPVAGPVPGDTFTDCTSCPEMVVLPPGKVLKGADRSDETAVADEQPGHWVHVSYPLAVSRYEITRKQFARFAEETGHTGKGCATYNGSWEVDPDRSWASPGFEQSEGHPATCISWNDAQAYIKWLSRTTGKSYRLLSASEWEYAAKRGNEKSSCESANVADLSTKAVYPGWEIANCRDNFVHTAPVGSFAPNRLGLYDMMGNVFEWVEDCWQPGYQGAPVDGSPRLDGDCSRRVLRGGSWFTRPSHVRAAFRNRFDLQYRSSSFGFRVARLP